jgi:biotin transport system substrate-specific component
MASIAQTSSRSQIGQDLLQIIGASLLISLCSQIKFVLPFTFIPLTMQTLAVLIVGASLGSTKGACAILCYYAQILMCLPVTSGGLVDPLIFVGPKGGYVLGWLAQAFIMGWFVEKSLFSKKITLFAGGLIACAVQMGMGLIVLAHFVGWSLAFPLGLYPFIPGEIIKVALLGYLPLKQANTP